MYSARKGFFLVGPLLILWFSYMLFARFRSGEFVFGDWLALGIGIILSLPVLLYMHRHWDTQRAATAKVPITTTVIIREPIVHYSRWKVLGILASIVSISITPVWFGISLVDAWSLAFNSLILVVLLYSYYKFIFDADHDITS